MYNQFETGILHSAILYICPQLLHISKSCIVFNSHVSFGPFHFFLLMHAWVFVVFQVDMLNIFYSNTFSDWVSNIRVMWSLIVMCLLLSEMCAPPPPCRELFVLSIHSNIWCFLFIDNNLFEIHNYFNSWVLVWNPSSFLSLSLVIVLTENLAIFMSCGLKDRLKCSGWIIGKKSMLHFCWLRENWMKFYIIYCMEWFSHTFLIACVFLIFSLIKLTTRIF